jgi:DNA-binding PucR family transcriptional regulator
MTVVEILEQAQALNQQERKELVKLLVDSLDVKEEESTTKKRSLLELRGLGAEIWEGIDAQEYVNQLRDEWD